MDEAAKDFAINYNLKSIEDNIEYATTIYKVKEKVTTTKYVKVNILYVLGISKNKFTNNDSLIVNLKVNKTKKVTMYTYTNVKKGKEHSSNPPRAPLFKKKSAVAHTHGAYDTQYRSDEFSSKDIDYSIKYGVPNYVATPSGTLRKYDPDDYIFGVDNSVELYDDLPFDPNHPDYIN